MTTRTLLALVTTLVFVCELHAQPQNACRTEGQDASAASQDYRAAVRDVSSSCTKPNGGCTAARLQADDALNLLLAAHQALLAVCVETTVPPPPPPPPIAPTVPGDLVISEFNALGFASLEWFEVHNPRSTDFDLFGLTISDGNGSSGEHFTITSHVVVRAGGYVVFGRQDAGSSEGVPVNFFYTGFILSNGEDTIEILNGTTSIDAVHYALPFPLIVDVSANLDPSVLDWQANDLASNWCAGINFISGNGNKGTPGAPNTPCIH
jgi:hypothetical protein